MREQVKWTNEVPALSVAHSHERCPRRGMLPPPNCYAPAMADIASQVPLCERHMLQVYRETNKTLSSHRAIDQQYELLPSEAEFIPGPCPACGTSGLLAHLANGFVACKSGNCTYEQHINQFCTERKDPHGHFSRH